MTPTPPTPGSAPWWVWLLYTIPPMGGGILAYFLARMKDRSENSQKTEDRNTQVLRDAYDRASAINADMVQTLVEQGVRQEDQIKALLAGATRTSNELAGLHESNLRSRIREAELNETVAALTRRVSSLQGSNTKLRHRVNSLEGQLREANLTPVPEEEDLA